MEAFNPTNSNQSNPLLFPNSEIERVISVKCKKHPQQNADLLHLAPNIKNARICITCAQEDKISFQNCLQIKSVLQTSNGSDLLNYPVFTDPQLSYDKQSNQAIQAINTSIDTFFTKLSTQILSNIEKSKQNQKIKIIKLEDLQQRYLACWEQILDIDKLKKILYQNNETELAEFIQNHIKNSEKNTAMIQENKNQLDAMKKRFSTEQANKSLNLISYLLDEINFFEDSSESSYITNDQSKQEKLQNKQEEVGQLKKLLNDCETQMNKDKKHLQEQRYLIESIQDYCRNHKKSSCFNFWGKTSIDKNYFVTLNNHLSNIKEAQSFKLEDLLPGTKLILGKCQDSKKLSVTKNNQKQLQFKNNTQKDYDGLSYLNFILKPSTNYIIHVLLEQTKGQKKNFKFGLLPDADKDATNLSSGRKLYSEYGKDYGDLKTYLKGKSIQTDAESLERKSLEMRINIERQILRVGSLPFYESVVQINDPTAIKPATHYRFYLEGLNAKTKITITKLETVSQFDESM